MLGPKDPRGTVEELQKMGVNLATTPSCSRRVVEDGTVVIAGCREWKRCTLKEKGVSGPVHKGVQAMKKKPDGTPVVMQTPMSCYHIPGYIKRIESKKGLVNIIASEGDMINCQGSEPRDITIPGQGMVRLIDDKVIPTKILPFPRPGTAGNLSQQGLAADMIAARKKEIAEQRPDEILGLRPEKEKK